MLENCSLHALFYSTKQRRAFYPAKDVDGIKYVINFDYPQSSEDYIHRIGRTGRSNTKGTSYAFFTQSNAKQSRALVEVLREANQDINPALEHMARNSRGFDGGRSRYNTGGRYDGTFKKGSIGSGSTAGGGGRGYGAGASSTSNGGSSRSGTSGFGGSRSSGYGGSSDSNGYNRGSSGSGSRHTRFD